MLTALPHPKSAFMHYYGARAGGAAYQRARALQNPARRACNSRRVVMMPVKINVKHFSQIATGSKPVLGH